MPLARKRRSDSAALSVALVAVLACAVAPKPATAQAIDPRYIGIENDVAAIERVGNTIYATGAFYQVGSNTGSGVVLDERTGKLLPRSPKLTGWVHAVVPDGTGGWFAGGVISAAGGKIRSGLAHLNEDGSVADWAPTCDGQVFALALHDGVLYVAGKFAHIDAMPRSNVAALDPLTGAVLPWAPEPDNVVKALLVRDSTILLGGSFNVVGGQPRRGLAEVVLSTGQPTAWRPTASTGPQADIRAMCEIGDTLFVGGKIIPFLGDPRWGLGAIHLGTGAVLPLAPTMTVSADRYDEEPYVAALAEGSGTLYVAGHFRTIAGEPREGLAEFDRTTGGLTSWAPALGPLYVWSAHFNYSLVVTQSSVFVGGTFRAVGDSARDCIAEIDRRTGLATAWNPGADRNVLALARADGKLFAGGWFTFVGDVQRRLCIAAINATTGELKDWNAGANLETYFIGGIAAHGDRVYVGGSFNHIGGQERWYAAALDTLTGQALDWDPQPSLPIDKMKVVGDKLFVSGRFRSIGGISRYHLASFDLKTGQLTDWDPHPDSEVEDFAVSGNVVYACGSFLTVRGTARMGAAAFDATTGALLDWNPNSQTFLRCVATRDTVVFLGGSFDYMGGQPRTSVAAVHAHTGALQEWRAVLSEMDEYGFRRPSVDALAVVRGELYVGGHFDRVNDLRRGGLVALDAATGAVLPWDPNLMDPFSQFPLDEAIIYALRPYGDQLYVGGRFRSAGTVPATNFAALPLIPEPPPPPPDQLTILAMAPNPAPTSVRIGFALPRASTVRLEVFDLQGRRIAAPIRDEAKPAGRNEVTLTTQSWAEGTYFCRLSTSESSVVRKFVVLR